MIYFLAGLLLGAIVQRWWSLALLSWFLTIGYMVGGFAGMLAGVLMFTLILWSQSK